MNVKAKRVLADGRSSRWAWMDRFEVPQYDGDGVYLTRWRVLRTPLFGIYVHRMSGPDPRPTLHDHPWSFLSVILRGGYVERRLDPMTMTVNELHTIRRGNRVAAKDAHSIRHLLRTPTWTLCLVGPERREWGYLDEYDGAGTWLWTPYHKHPHAAEFDAALARRKAKVDA